MIAAITIPWMLMIKPYLLRREHLKKVAAGYNTLGGDSPGATNDTDSAASPTRAAASHGGGHGGHGEVLHSMDTLV